MVEEQYEVTVEKKKSSTAGIILAVLVIGLLILIPLYMMTYTTVEERVGNQPVEAEEYNASNLRDDRVDTQQSLAQNTGMLGTAVYAANDDVLGTVYNVYSDRDTGAIRWVSILEDNDLSENIRLIPVSRLESGLSDEIININLTLADFLEIPVQTAIDDRLAGLISIRDLPGSTILDPVRGEIGNVLSVTYDQGKVNRVNFITDRDQQEFYIPFEYLDYSNLGESYNQDYNIELSERQAGAIQMYLETTGQIEALEN